MAKTLNGRPADCKAEIANEVDLALQKLGAKPGLPSQTGSKQPMELYALLRKHGAKSDLLKIIGSWQETMDDQWVLNELHRWNIGAH